TGCFGTSRSCSSSRPRRGPSAPAPRPSPSCRTRGPRRTSASHYRRMGRTTTHPSPTRRHRPRSSPRRRRRRPGSISSRNSLLDAHFVLTCVAVEFMQNIDMFWHVPLILLFQTPIIAAVCIAVVVIQAPILHTVTDQCFDWALVPQPTRDLYMDIKIILYMYILQRAGEAVLRRR
ncbi:hypothetical protein ACJX0J_025532, partial [Zea mays]